MAHNAGAGTSSARLAGPESGSSVVAALQARQPKAGAKRGRKRIQDKTHDQDESSTRASGAREADPNEKRKLQNRAAQRAFRERKEQHVKDMEVATVAQAAQLQHYYNIIQSLMCEVEALRRGEVIQPGVTSLPSPPIMAPTMNDSNPTLTSPPPNSYVDDSPSDVKPEVPLTMLVPKEELHPDFSPSFDDAGAETELPDITPFNLGPNLAVTGSYTTNVPVFPTMAQMGSSLPGQTQHSLALAPTPVPHMDDGSLLADVEMTSFSTFDDFDAPFNLTSAVPLPPLFNELFSQSFAPLPLSTPSAGLSLELSPAPDTRTAAARQADDAADEDEDFCPIDDTEPDPAPIPFGRLPCVKPECDFTSMACSLPQPWRPPSLEDDVRSRDVWVAQVAWAKLVSHPQFKDCDVDELCAELRDRARCSDDGRVVISKMEACDVFRSIPKRARMARDRMGI